MDKFLNNTEQLRQHYYQKIPNSANNTQQQDLDTTDIALLGVRGLQYLAYYLYRVWFKYLNVIIASNDSIIGSRARVMDPIISKLDISGSARQSILSYQRPAPLSGRMPNDPDNLNELILELQRQLSEVVQYQEAIAPGARHKQYDALSAFINKKEKMETVVEDITRLKLLLPSLGKPYIS